MVTVFTDNLNVVHLQQTFHEAAVARVLKPVAGQLTRADNAPAAMGPDAVACGQGSSEPLTARLMDKVIKDLCAAKAFKGSYDALPRPGQFVRRTLASAALVRQAMNRLANADGAKGSLRGSCDVDAAKRDLEDSLKAVLALHRQKPSLNGHYNGTIPSQRSYDAYRKLNYSMNVCMRRVGPDALFGEVVKCLVPHVLSEMSRANTTMFADGRWVGAEPFEMESFINTDRVEKVMHKVQAVLKRDECERVKNAVAELFKLPSLVVAHDPLSLTPPVSDRADAVPAGFAPTGHAELDAALVRLQTLVQGVTDGATLLPDKLRAVVNVMNGAEVADVSHGHIAAAPDESHNSVAVEDGSGASLETSISMDVPVQAGTNTGESLMTVGTQTIWEERSSVSTTQEYAAFLDEMMAVSGQFAARRDNHVNEQRWTTEQRNTEAFLRAATPLKSDVADVPRGAAQWVRGPGTSWIRSGQASPQGSERSRPEVNDVQHQVHGSTASLDEGRPLQWERGSNGSWFPTHGNQQVTAASTSRQALTRDDVRSGEAVLLNQTSVKAGGGQGDRPVADLRGLEQRSGEVSRERVASARSGVIEPQRRAAQWVLGPGGVWGRNGHSQAQTQSEAPGEVQPSPSEALVPIESSSDQPTQSGRAPGGFWVPADQVQSSGGALKGEATLDLQQRANPVAGTFAAGEVSGVEAAQDGVLQDIADASGQAPKSHVASASVTTSRPKESRPQYKPASHFIPGWER